MYMVKRHDCMNFFKLSYIYIVVVRIFIMSSVVSIPIGNYVVLVMV